MSYEPVIFQFSFKDAWGGNILSVEWAAKKSVLLVEEGDNSFLKMSGKSVHAEYKIGDKQWRGFWVKLQSMKAWDWPEEIRRPGGGYSADGNRWTMTVGYKRRLIHTRGYNAYPLGKKDMKQKGGHSKAKWTNKTGTPASCTYEFVRLLNAITKLYLTHS